MALAAFASATATRLALAARAENVGSLSRPTAARARRAGSSCVLSAVPKLASGPGGIATTPLSLACCASASQAAIVVPAVTVPQMIAMSPLAVGTTKTWRSCRTAPSCTAWHRRRQFLPRPPTTAYRTR